MRSVCRIRDRLATDHTAMMPAGPIVIAEGTVLGGVVALGGLVILAAGAALKGTQYCTRIGKRTVHHSPSP